MARAIWTGGISFGLVNVPVNLYSAESRDELSFSMLDKRDMSPIGYKKVSKATGREVPREDVVKAYEYEEGRFVPVADEDFKRASPARSQRIDVVAFVDASAIDPAYFQTPYYLEPAGRSDKHYALLREALQRSGKVGVAQVVLRSREYLCALMPRGELLLLELLRYPHELRDPSELKLPERGDKSLKITEAELKMAERLIDDLADGWEPGKYKDRYREELLAFIKRKAEKGESAAVAAAPKEAATAAPADIMSLLKKSVARAERQRGKHGPLLH
jgi:DNA end-binding protein Ku